VSGVEVVFSALKSLAELGGRFAGDKVAEKHIEFLRDQLTVVGQSYAKAEEKAGDLERKVADLEAQIASEWKLFRGVYFRLLPSGKMDPSAHCPGCRKPLVNRLVYFSGEATDDYICGVTGCGWHGQNIGRPEALFPAVAKEYGVELGGQLV
jgi:hypothetical protein